MSAETESEKAIRLAKERGYYEEHGWQIKYPTSPRPGSKIPPAVMRDLVPVMRRNLDGAVSSLTTWSAQIRVIAKTKSYENAINEETGESYTSMGEFIITEFGEAARRLKKSFRQDYVKTLTEAGLSQRAIADLVGVDQATVSRDQKSLRDKASEESSDADASVAEPEMIQGKDGRMYERKKRAPEPEPEAEPEPEPELPPIPEPTVIVWNPQPVTGERDEDDGDDPPRANQSLTGPIAVAVQDMAEHDLLRFNQEANKIGMHVPRVANGNKMELRSYGSKHIVHAEKTTSALYRWWTRERLSLGHSAIHDPKLILTGANIEFPPWMAEKLAELMVDAILCAPHTEDVAVIKVLESVVKAAHDLDSALHGDPVGDFAETGDGPF